MSILYFSSFLIISLISSLYTPQQLNSSPPYKFFFTYSAQRERSCMCHALRHLTATKCCAPACALTVYNEFTLYQNQPNPFQEETVIGFNLPEAGAVRLSIYDVSGKMLKVINGDFAKGYNQVSVTLTRNELAASGVLYYQVDTANDSKTMKMIIVE